ncbi:winged helix-turn-helix transcriptional regulator [Actinokineospora sp.]|uniref:winged helix-turn-helix transcriptional regulator n=1 Tax=Actinokineospora sp. TaxID=1872133 RepID=UPI003D6B4301
MKVLLVEEGRYLADHVEATLEPHASVLAVAHNDKEAIELLATDSFHVVIVSSRPHCGQDVDLCGQLRIVDPFAQLLALVVEPHADEQIARLSGLDVDGFLTVPCPPAELVARVRAAVRRASSRVERADIVLESKKQGVRRSGGLIPLAKKEFALLIALMRANGAVLSAEQLHRRTRHLGPWRVRQTVMTLRRKLGEPEVIRSVRGFGYRFEPLSPHGCSPPDFVSCGSPSSG